MSETNKKWKGEKLWLGALWAGMVSGAVAFGIISLFSHTHEFRTSWEPTWGLLVTSFEFFVLCGAGLAVVSAAVFLAGGQPIQGLCRRMATFSALGLVIGLGLVIIELTQPTRLSMASVLGPVFYKKLFLALSWFAATLGALYALHIQLRRNRTIAVLALGTSVFLLSCLGIFQMGDVLGQFGHPPQWLTAPAFIDYLLAALLSGTALCFLIFFLGRKFSGLRPARDYSSVLQLLRKWSIALLTLYAFSLLIIFYTYASGQLNSHHPIAPFLFTGSLAFNFWGLQVVVGLLLPMLLLVISRAVSVERLAVAGALILTGQFFRSYDMIIAGQLQTFHAEASFLVNHGLLAVTPCLPKTFVVVGAICFFLFVMTFSEKTKPWSDPTQEEK